MSPEKVFFALIAVENILKIKKFGPVLSKICL